MSDHPSQTAQGPRSLGYGDYLRFGKLAQDCCGLRFSESRRTDLERGVWQAFAASTCADLDEYYRLLQEPGRGAVHMERLINALTVGETHFFRDAAQFDVLYNHVLPQIVEQRRPLRTLRIWSAGCASGEEPYSIAMVLRELLPDVDEWAITILGTDINTTALERARRAVYGEWAFRELRARHLQSTYFRRTGKKYELLPEVRRMVTLSHLNLMKDLYPSYETNTTLMDLILCRNVMMYFSEPGAGEVVRRFYRALIDGGWLVVGHAEHALVSHRRFQVHSFPHAMLYRRSEIPSYLPRDWHWLAPPPRVEKETRPAPQAAAPPPAKDTRPSSTPLLALEEESAAANGDQVQRAQELLDYGHSEQARQLLLGIAEEEPRDALVCTLLGRAHANLGYWQEAEVWCRRAIGLEKLALEAYYVLALVLQHQGRLEEAVDAMRKVIYIDRHYVLGHFGLADLYHSSGQLPQALKALDNALRLLETHADGDLVPGSSDVAVGRLRRAIIGQQQRWSAQAIAS